MATPVTTSYVVPSSVASATPTSTTAPGSGHSNNPLLFFVALGFGVLFTNLWIIIGVKYCFRYQNARRRGLTLNGPDGVAMNHMHHGRRRREKKLMTMEEVESKFPQMTYKAWRTQRAQAGLSTEGGVEAVGQEEAETAREVLNVRSPSRAGSIRSCRTARSRPASMHTIEPIVTGESAVYEVGKGDMLFEQTSNPHTEVAAPGKGNKRSSISVEEEVALPARSRLSTSSRGAAHSSSVDNVEGDAHPQEIVEETEAEAEAEADECEIQHLRDDIGTGDTCAICIEQLEEEDEVRGLTCGHTFHCSCVDVWLTTRRAICPLCKRDYWVRPGPAPNAEGAGTLGDNEVAPPGPAARVYHPFGTRVWRSNLFGRSNANARPAVVRTTTADLESGRLYREALERGRHAFSRR